MYALTYFFSMIYLLMHRSGRRRLLRRCAHHDKKNNEKAKALQTLWYLESDKHIAIETIRRMKSKTLKSRCKPVEKVSGKEARWESNGEFDPGSGRTLAACLTHASRTEIIIKLALK